VTDAVALGRAYDLGFSRAEDDTKNHGEKRWMEMADLDMLTEEELDSYWAGYGDYTDTEV
jgi:hypothetical protein